MRRKYKTLSRTSPKGSSRACLCKGSNTYSIKCCDGSLWAQGIGSIHGEALTTVWYGYDIEDCATGKLHHVHTHDTQLEIGKVYYFVLENQHNGCHTVIQERQSEGQHIESISVAYSDCTECQANN